MCLLGVLFKRCKMARNASSGNEISNYMHEKELRDLVQLCVNVYDQLNYFIGKYVDKVHDGRWHFQ